MTPADLSALMERLKMYANESCGGRLEADLLQAADLLSRCRDALRGGVLVPMEPTVEEKKYIVASLLIQLWVTLPAVEPGTMPNYEQAWAIAKSVLDAAPQAGAKEGG